MSEPRPFVFLDRDGTLIEDRVYAHRVDDCVPLPGALAAVKRLREAGFGVVIVTNQSGIGRGYFDETALAAFHARLQLQLEQAGTSIDAVYHCPHLPEVACSCRKPETGMIERACQEHAIDLERSWVIGDSPADVELAERAGCRGLLVQSGITRREQLPPDLLVAEDLSAAVAQILAS